jgi:predicted MFS family arabinose efflux permease
LPLSVAVRNADTGFATVTNPSWVVVVQNSRWSDGRVFAVMVPLIIADLTRGTGHFNLGQGIVGTATGIGASVSASLAGHISDHFGSPASFAGLASIGFIGLLAVWFLMPETRDTADPE